MSPAESGAEIFRVPTPNGELRAGRQGSDGPPVLLVHGFGGDLQNWLFVSHGLADGHRAFVMDLPAHGESSTDLGGDGEAEALVAAVEAVIDRIGGRHVHLVGHSLGGRTAAEAAMCANGRVGSLTLIAPAGFGAAVDREFLEGFLAAGSVDELAPVLERLFAQPGIVTEQLVAAVLAQRDREGARESLRAIADGPLAERSVLEFDELAAAGIPLQVIWGGEDRIIPRPAELDPALRLHRLDGVGHMPHLEAAAGVCEAIAELVAEEEATG